MGERLEELKGEAKKRGMAESTILTWLDTSEMEEEPPREPTKNPETVSDELIQPKSSDRTFGKVPNQERELKKTNDLDALAQLMTALQKEIEKTDADVSALLDEEKNLMKDIKKNEDFLNAVIAAKPL
jgi:hypothetical protein